MKLLSARTLFALAVLLLLACASHAQDLAPLPLEPAARSLEALALFAPSASSAAGAMAAQAQDEPPSLPAPPSVAEARLPQAPAAPRLQAADPRLVRAIVEGQIGAFGRPVEVTLVDGRKLQGRAQRGSDTTFHLRMKGAKFPQVVLFRDVIAARVIPPNAGERVAESAEVAGLSVALVVMIPFVFAWGLSCGFHCS